MGESNNDRYSDGSYTRSSRRAARKRDEKDPAKTVALTLGAVALFVLAALALYFTATSDSSPIPQTTVAVESTVTAEPTSTPSIEPTPPAPPEPEPLREFDAEEAMVHVRALEGFGVHGAGSDAEGRAAEYIAQQLRSFGLQTRIDEFQLPNGKTSRNVVARIEGDSDKIIVLGSHFDSKPPSPGANDNGTGTATTMMLADILLSQPVTPTIEIVLFGSEERIDGDPSHHHYGSRHRVSQMTAAERAATAGMFSIDMIGYGPDFHSRTMSRGPQTLSDRILVHAGEQGIPMTFKKDTGETGWSDHEPYELAGIPVSWIEWRDDPEIHTANDRSDRVVVGKVQTTGDLMLSYLRSLTEEDLSELTTR